MCVLATEVEGDKAVGEAGVEEEGEDVFVGVGGISEQEFSKAIAEEDDCSCMLPRGVIAGVEGAEYVNVAARDNLRSVTRFSMSLKYRLSDFFCHLQCENNHMKR